jgi:hypothetical protein
MVKKKPNRPKKKKIAKKEARVLPEERFTIRHPLTGTMHRVPDPVPGDIPILRYTPVSGTPLGDRLDVEMEIEVDLTKAGARQLKKTLKKLKLSEDEEDDLIQIHTWEHWKRLNAILERYNRLERIRAHHAGEVE